VGLGILALLGAAAGLTSAPRFPPRSLMILALPVAATILSLLLSDFTNRGLQLVLSLLPALLLYCLIAGFFRRQDIILLFWVWTGFVLFLAIWLLTVAALHPYQTPTQWIQLSRVTAFKVPNDITLLTILMPVAVVLFLLKKRLWHKALPLSALGLGLLVSVLYQSRLGVIAAVIGIGMTLLLSAWTLTQDPTKKTLLFPSKRTLVLGLSFSLTLIFITDAVTGFQLLSKLTQPWTTRLPLWLAALCMFSNSPGWGNGPGSFLLLYRECLQSWQMSHLLAVDPRITPWAHNLYLEILAEQGLIGFTAWMVSLGLVFQKGVKSLPNTNCFGHQIFAVGIFTSLSIFCLIGFFELSLWRQWVAPLLLSLMAACLKWVESPPEQ